MSNEVREEYLRSLYDLSKVDPAKWATFVEAFRAYTMVELEKGLSTPIGLAATFIGDARRMKEQRDDFINIETIMDKLRKPSHGTI
jgi:hypothetical protein